MNVVAAGCVSVILAQRRLEASELPDAALPDLNSEMVYDIHSEPYRGEGADEDEEEAVGVIFGKAM